MDQILKLKLSEKLKKQQYPNMWEIKLFSMLNEVDKNKFITFVNACESTPMAAITTPQHSALKKTDEQIIDFMTKLNQVSGYACVVIAHAHYNPANLQAVYVLEYKNGEEKECFEGVREHWKKCSELYFIQAGTSVVSDLL
ncbi:MAG TPA: hypothetical protein PK886_01830 [Candidatus Paceibacterota bacterium]|nr:hypothetical protein [Candidatus Paceibacterota bacterium]